MGGVITPTTAALAATGVAAILAYLVSRNSDPPPNKLRVVAACLACALVVYGVVYTMLCRSTGLEDLRTVWKRQTRPPATTMEKAQKAASAARSQALAMPQVAGDEGVAKGDHAAYMHLLSRVQDGMVQEMTADPGYRRAASHISNPDGDEVPDLAQSQAQLHGLRDIVKTHKPSSLTDPSLVHHATKTLTGVELGAQSESVMRNFTGGTLGPGSKAERPENLQRISGTNAHAVRAEGENAGILTPEGGQGGQDELESYWASSDIGGIDPGSDSDALLQQARDNAARG